VDEEDAAESDEDHANDCWETISEDTDQGGDESDQKNEDDQEEKKEKGEEDEEKGRGEDDEEEEKGKGKGESGAPDTPLFSKTLAAQESISHSNMYSVLAELIGGAGSGESRGRGGVGAKKKKKKTQNQVAWVGELLALHGGKMQVRWLTGRCVCVCVLVCVCRRRGGWV